MKKIVPFFYFLTFFIVACNNTSKDSVAIADSTNKAIQDSAINENKIIIDEESSAFLVRLANTGMTEAKLTTMALSRAENKSVKELAANLSQDHHGLNSTVKELAAQKKIVLPENISEENQKEINELDKKSGKDFDKMFINLIISKHQNSIDLFEKAIAKTKDYDIKTFAEKTLLLLKAHLESAKLLQKI